MFHTTTVLKYWAKDLPTLLVTKPICHDYMLQLLTCQAARVEIWENKGKWIPTKHASPGNLQTIEDLITTTGDIIASSTVLACRFNQKDGVRFIGTAFTDVTNQKMIGMCEFFDNASLTNFENLLIQKDVKEVLISEDIYPTDLKKLQEILQSLNIAETVVSRSCFKTSNIEQDLSLLIESEIPILQLPEMDLAHSLFAVACLIHKLDLVSTLSNHSKYVLRKFDISEYMKLDAAAVQALHLTSSLKDGNNKTMNLFGLLNQCKTAQGSRLLSQWIKQPLLSIKDITLRQDLVQAFVEDSGARLDLQVSKINSRICI